MAFGISKSVKIWFYVLNTLAMIISVGIGLAALVLGRWLWITSGGDEAEILNGMTAGLIVVSGSVGFTVYAMMRLAKAEQLRDLLFVVGALFISGPIVKFIGMIVLTDYLYVEFYDGLIVFIELLSSFLWVGAWAGVLVYSVKKHRDQVILRQSRM